MQLHFKEVFYYKSFLRKEKIKSGLARDSAVSLLRYQDRWLDPAAPQLDF